MMGDDGGGGRELWGAVAGAASEIAQIGEHLLASGLSDAVGTEHVGKMDRLRMVRNCATWSARRECDAGVMHG